MFLLMRSDSFFSQQMKVLATIVTLFAAGVFSIPNGASVNEVSGVGNTADGLITLAKADVCPPPNDCYYDGTAPFCAGACPTGYQDCGRSGTGCGASCVTGLKVFCCRGPCPA